MQFVTLTARDKMPAAYSLRAYVTAGGLMSYGADFADSASSSRRLYRQKSPRAPSPPTCRCCSRPEFEFVINMQTARALGIEVPSGLLSIADEVIE